MPEFDVILEGRFDHKGRLVAGEIGILDGRIKRVAKSIRSTDPRVRLGQSFICPAGIDIHVHLRDPGYTHKEDFGTGTASAAFGGVTAVLDMPNTSPAVTTPTALLQKLASVRKRANVDFGLYAALTSGSRTRLLAAAASGFKLYTGETTGDLTFDEPDELPIKLSEVAETGKPLVVHAEDDGTLMALKHLDIDPPGHAQARPPRCEQAAVGRVLEANGEANAKLHFTHVSSSSTLPLIAGTGYTSDVTPHHLFLRPDKRRMGFHKVNPPLRSGSEPDELWKALVEGRISFVASDHAPHTIDEKEQPWDRVPSGVPGVETMMPLLAVRLRAGDISPERFVQVTSTAAADLFGLRRGRITEGYPADLCAFDLTSRTTIRAERLHSKCGWTPFGGMDGCFPTLVMLRGNVLVKDGNLEAERSGRFIGDTHDH